MMQWSDIPFTPSALTLRQFAGLLLVISLAAAVWFGLVREPDGVMPVVALVGVAVGLAGLAMPPVIRPVFVAWMVVAFPIGWTVSRLLVALMFYALMTPLGVAFRLMGRDRLQLARPERASHWIPKRPPSEMRSYLRQF